MYKYILLIGFISISLFSKAQTKGTIKLYGYTQSVSRSKAPERNPVSGMRTSTGSGKNYFLYAVSPGRIYPTEIWLEGKRFGLSLKTITSPVEYSDEANIGSPKTVLVSKTSQKVIQLVPIATTATKQVGVKAKSLSMKNEVVLIYKRGTQFYYAVLEKLSALNSASMQ